MNSPDIGGAARFPGFRRAACATALTGAIAIMAACSKGGPGAPAAGRGAPIPVRVEKVSPAPWIDGTEVTGTVQAFRQATSGTVLIGRVERILHREGDRVRAGAALARIESRDVSARLAQAESAVVAARAQEENARLTRDRLERLHARQAAPKRSLDDSVAGYEAARAGREAAEEGVKAARVYVGYASVTAPFDGVVTARRIEVGDIAAPGMPLFVVEDLSRVKIEAAVPESLASRLKLGDPVEIDVPASGGARSATLTEILPSTDAASRTLTVRAVLDNPDGLLRSGMFARLRIPGEASPALTVPSGAVVRRGPLTGLFVVDDRGIARLRYVSLGAERGDRVRVLSGLAPGDAVALDPPDALEDGSPVQVR